MSMTQLLSDPTFGVLVAFCIFVIFAARRLWTAGMSSIQATQKTIRDEMDEAVQLLQEAKEALAEATQKGADLAHYLGQIQEDTKAQLFHIKTSTESAKRALEQKSKSSMDKRLKAVSASFDRHMLQLGTDILLRQAQERIQNLSATAPTQASLTPNEQAALRSFFENNSA